MTTQADARATEAPSPVAGDPSVGGAQNGPLVYLGIRRGWWVVLCVLLLVAVDVIPAVGPYLALAVLMWMVSGLARAKPRPARAVRVRRAAQPRRSTGRGRGTALSS